MLWRPSDHHRDIRARLLAAISSSAVTDSASAGDEWQKIFGDGYSEVRLTDERRQELIKGCERQGESCRYTAAGLYIWQKRARLWRNGFVIAPIILGGLASSQIPAGFRRPGQPW